MAALQHKGELILQQLLKASSESGGSHFSPGPVRTVDVTADRTRDFGFPRKQKNSLYQEKPEIVNWRNFNILVLGFGNAVMALVPVSILRQARTTFRHIAPKKWGVKCELNVIGGPIGLPLQRLLSKQYGGQAGGNPSDRL